MLADNEARISAEARVDLPRALWNQATTPEHVVAFLCCAAIFAAYVSGADGDHRRASHSSLVVCVVLLLASVGVNVSLVCLRLHKLRWEVHSRVTNAVLEFERACTSLRPANPAAGTASSVGPAAPGAQPASAVFVDGAVVHAGSAWRALDFHDPSKSMHTVPVYRDGAWVRLPVLLLVRGDLIALLGGEPAPTRGRCVDAGGSGRRSSMTALYRNFRAAQQARAGSRRSSSAGAQLSRPPPVRPEPRQGRVRDVEVLTLCGDMRRYALDDTPAAVALRKRLRTPHRPQPLFLTQLRSMGRLALLWQGGLGLAAAAAVVVRSVFTPSGVPDAHPDNSVLAPRPEALVGAVEGALVQLPTLLLCLSPLTLSALLALCELLLTASVLASYELALLRFKWKAWKRDLNLRLLVNERAELHGQQASAATTAAAVDLGSVEQRSRHVRGQRAGATFPDGAKSESRPAAPSLSWMRWILGARARPLLQQPDTMVTSPSLGPDPSVGLESAPPGDALHPFIVDGDGAAASLSDAPPASAPPAGVISPAGESASLAGVPGGDASLASRLQAARAAADVGGVSLDDGEFLPRAYTDHGHAALGMPALLLDDALRDGNPHGGGLPQPTLAPSSGWFPSAFLLCERRKAPLPVRRVFNGTPFHRVVAHWTGPTSSRIFFYARRLCCVAVRPTRLANVVPTRPVAPSARRASAHRHHHHHHQLPAAQPAVVGSPSNPDSASQARSETLLQRWSNSFFADALVDVGFGLSPIASPLSSSQILLRLGSATVFCCADRSTVSDPDPVVENVLLLKGETGSTIIDLHADDASPTGVRFDDGRWKRHIASLKPVGLACLLNSREASANGPSAPPAPPLTAAATSTAQTPDAKPRQKRTKRAESKPRAKGDPKSDAVLPGTSKEAGGESAPPKSAPAAGAISLRSLVPNLLRRSKPADVTAQPQVPGRGVAGADTEAHSHAAVSGAALPATSEPAPSAPPDYSISVRPSQDPSPGPEPLSVNALAPVPAQLPFMVSSGDPAKSSLLSRVLRGGGARPQVSFVTAESPRDSSAPAIPERDGDSSSVGSSKPPRSTRFRLPFGLKRQLESGSSRRTNERPDGDTGESRSAAGTASALAEGASAEPMALEGVPPPPSNVGASVTVAASHSHGDSTGTQRVESGDLPVDAGSTASAESAPKGKFSLSSIIPGGLRDKLSVRKWISPSATSDSNVHLGSSDVAAAEIPSTDETALGAPPTLAGGVGQLVTETPAGVVATVAIIESVVGPGAAEGPAPHKSGSESDGDDEGDSGSDESASDDGDAVSEYSFDSSESDDDDEGDSGVEDEDSVESDESGVASDDSSVDSARLQRLQQRQARMARRIPLAPSVDDDVAEPKRSALNSAPLPALSAAVVDAPLALATTSALPSEPPEPPLELASSGSAIRSPRAESAPRQAADGNTPRAPSGRRRVSAAASLYRSALSRRLLAGRAVALAASPLQAHSSFAGDLVTTAAPVGESLRDTRGVRGDSCGSGQEIIQSADLAPASCDDGGDGAPLSREGTKLGVSGPKWLQSPLLLRGDDEYIVGLSDHTAVSLDERLQPRTVETLYRSHAFTISGGVLSDERRRSSPALPEPFKRPSVMDATSDAGETESASGFKSPVGVAGDSSNTLVEETPVAADAPEVVPRDRGDEQWTASGGIVRACSSSALDQVAVVAVDALSPELRPARQQSSRHRHRHPVVADAAAGQRISKRLSPVARRKAGHGAVLPHVNVDELVQVIRPRFRPRTVCPARLLFF